MTQVINYTVNFKVKDFHRVKPIMKRGEINGYEFCNPRRGECNDEFRQITPHDMCKLSKNINKVKSGIVKKITNVIPDCHSI